MNGVPSLRAEGGPPPATLPPEIVEKVVVGGDLAKLDSKQRLAYYKARCDAAGLDIRTRPFEYIVLQNRLTLYATKSWTDNLTAIHGLTVEVKSHRRDNELGIYIAEARASFPHGRYTDDIGVTPLKGLGVAEACNAMMRAVTKAKRRAVLSACGLGDVIDESEVETTGAAHHAKFLDNQTGHGTTGAYAKPESVAEYKQWLSGFVETVNAKWLDRYASDGNPPPGFRELLSTWQLSGHLVKWGKAEGHIQAPDEPRTRQYDPLAAILYERHFDTMVAEARRYAREKWREEAARLEGPGPEDESQEAGDPDDATYPDEPQMEV